MPQRCTSNPEPDSLARVWMGVALRAAENAIAILVRRRGSIPSDVSEFGIAEAQIGHVSALFPEGGQYH